MKLTQGTNQFSADVQPIPYVREHSMQPGNVGSAVEQAGLQAKHALGTVTNMIVSQRAYEEQQDSAAATKDAAIVRQQAIEKLDELRQSGKPIIESFTNYLNGAMDGARENRTTRVGQQLWDTHAAHMVADLGHSARLLDADREGQNAKNDVKQTLDANGITLQRDPTLLQRVQQENHDSVMGLNIPIQLKQELILHADAEAAKNAAQGWIMIDPHGAKDRLNNRDDIMSTMLTADERFMLLARADSKIRSDEEAQRVAFAQRAQQAKLKNDQIMNDLLVRMHRGALATTEVDKLSQTLDSDGRPAIEPQQVDHIYNYMEREAKEGPARTKPEWAGHVIMRILNETITPEEIIQLGIERKISTPDAERWALHAGEGRSALKAMRAQAVKAASVQFGIYPGLEGFAGPEAQQARANYLNYLGDQEAALRKAGKPATDFYTEGIAQEAVQKFVPTGTKMPLDQLKAAGEAGTPVMLGGMMRVWDKKGPLNKIESWTPVNAGAPGGANAAPSAPGGPAAPAASSENPFEGIQLPQERSHSAPPTAGVGAVLPREQQGGQLAKPVAGQKRPAMKGIAPDYVPANETEAKAYRQELIDEAKKLQDQIQEAWQRRAQAAQNDHREQYEKAWSDYRDAMHKYNEVSRKLEKLQKK